MYSGPGHTVVDFDTGHGVTQGVALAAASLCRALGPVVFGAAVSLAADRERLFLPFAVLAASHLVCACYAVAHRRVLDGRERDDVSETSSVASEDRDTHAYRVLQAAPLAVDSRETWI